MTAAAAHLLPSTFRPAGPRQRRNWLMPAGMVIMAALPILLLVVGFMALMGW